MGASIPNASAPAGTPSNPPAVFWLGDRPGVTFLVEPGVEASGPGSYGRAPGRMQESAANDELRSAWLKVGKLVEAMSPTPSGAVAVFTKQNLLAKAVHAAFYDHHPLVLSPDVIWLTIAQGLAHHVDENAEALRDHFVHHKGKRELVVERPKFIKGSAHNDWEGVFPEFRQKISESSRPGAVELIESDFTTTGPAERVASHVTLMDAVQHYFSYTMVCGCGFPSITLTGTPGDWEKIRAKAGQLGRFQLDWWLEVLLPVLDQFVQAAHGKPDLDFWRSLCMITVVGPSGLSHYNKPLTGWIQAFFPYVMAPVQERFGEETQNGKPKGWRQRNAAMASYVQSFEDRVNLENFGTGERDVPVCFRRPLRLPLAGQGVKLERFPPAMSSAPVRYIDRATGETHEMAFFGGLTCLLQHPDGSIEPKIGWAVLDSGNTC